jgi:CubicO group peptidase (beta-lactamase class C family)
MSQNRRGAQRPEPVDRLDSKFWTIGNSNTKTLTLGAASDNPLVQRRPFLTPQVAIISSTSLPSATDGLTRASAGSVGIDAARIAGFIDDVEAAGLELHDIMLWRDGAVVAEGWHWPYSAERRRMTHSMTKSITACAIGMLVDAGRLSLDDTVCSFFPEAAVDPASATARMTVEDLLTMRSGQGSEVSGSIWRGIATSWIDEFFRIPLDHEPGTVHVYSSAASYMLSAVVTRVTGETIHDFLTPRLFAPLGITNVTWDIGPDGVNPGGNGVSFTIADGLKLGILHAQKGVWQGQRILSKQWVEQATRAQGSPEYGYHWVIGDTYYAALGQFVQMIVVYPTANAVLALNGAMEESSVLRPHLKRHFPAAFAGAGDAASEVALTARLSGWAEIPALPSLTAGDAAGLAGGWVVDDNELGLARLDFAFSDDALRFSITDREGTHAVVAGLDGWHLAPTYLPGASLHHGYRLEDAPTFAGARWLAADQLELVLHFVESVFRDTFTFMRDGDQLTMARRVNINSAARAWPVVTATRA